VNGPGTLQDDQKLTMMIEERFATSNSVDFDRKYADRLRVYVKAGNGGNGSAALFRANYAQILPNGGDGGSGGNVYFQAHSFIRNLYQLKRAHFKGNPGKHGMGQCKHGHNAKDIRHTVPLGTEIYKIVKANPSVIKKNRETEHRILLADLDREEKEVLVARGGQAGRGNFNHRHIQETEMGGEGEEFEIELVLKTLADVGLVGFPNAGKSTFLASVSRAFPKIAPYPFTTLRPYVGNCKFVDGKKMSIADLPGLIKGAHANKGLGHEFLRHIERTKVILYVIDGTGDDARRPVNDYKTLRNELKLYDPNLLNFKSLIAVNKCDRDHTKFQEKFAELHAIAHTKCIPMSAKMSINIQDVILALRGLVYDETKQETIEKMSKYDFDQNFL
jgi:GTP-binding protein